MLEAGNTLRALAQNGIMAWTLSTINWAEVTLMCSVKNSSVKTLAKPWPDDGDAEEEHRRRRVPG